MKLASDEVGHEIEMPGMVMVAHRGQTSLDIHHPKGGHMSLYTRNATTQIAKRSDGPRTCSDVFPIDWIFSAVSHLYDNVASNDNAIRCNSCRAADGSLIASPSNMEGTTDQNYLYHWVRDSALCTLSLSTFYSILKHSTTLGVEDILKHFSEYVDFCKISTTNALLNGADLNVAKYFVNGSPDLNWTRQNDGPALRACSLISISSYLPDRNIDITQLVEADIDYVLSTIEVETFNIWEESFGVHFFTSAVQRRALNMYLEFGRNNNVTLKHQPLELDNAILRLNNLIAQHWKDDHYRANLSSSTERGCDINSEVMLALLYSGDKILLSSNKALSTVTKIIGVFANPSGNDNSYYTINGADAAIGLGPSVGRYPFDEYDGDMRDLPNVGHPWYLITAELAAYCYQLAALFSKETNVIDSINPGFLQWLGFQNMTPTRLEFVSALEARGDRIVETVKYHSGAKRKHLNEQYDRNTGFALSVEDLSWSYASFLNAYTAKLELASIQDGG